MALGVAVLLVALVVSAVVGASIGVLAEGALARMQRRNATRRSSPQLTLGR